MHTPNTVRLPRSQWRVVEGRLRDCLKRLGVPIAHRLSAGSDCIICHFFDTQGQRLQTKDVLNIEALARQLADDG